MDADYALGYRELFERHWWWRAREHAVIATLEELTAGRGSGPILDIGCGDGLFFDQLRRFGEPEGLEPDATIVTDAGRARGPIHTVPFDQNFAPGRRYRLIVMLDVLEHLDDDRAALARVHELLEPGGHAVITVPAFRALWTRHDDINHHRTRYTRRTLQAALAGSGLEVVQLRYFFHWLAPLKVAVRCLEAMIPGQARPAQVPPPPVNRCFYWLSRLEQATWGRLPWPFGTSLELICRRPNR
jgi:SAM-dependent methyltransferase